MTVLEPRAENLEPASAHVALTPTLLLTSKGGAFELTKELQQLCALTVDGKLFVSAAHLADPHVMAFMDRLETDGHTFELQQCSMTQLNEMYQSHERDAVDGHAVDTVRQAQAIAILGDAHKRGASDVHIVVGHQITRIYYRIHGLLWEAAQEKSIIGREICSALFNSMCDVTKDHYQPQISQDARVRREYVEQLGLFGARLATRPLIDGPLMVLRLLYDDQRQSTLSDLGFLPEQIALFERLRSLPFGLNLFTGPTGSGKSKSLQITMNLLWQETAGTKHILTIEDPPEYPIKANQSPLSRGETWDNGITNTMRLDPDVLMYGELRDVESAQSAYRGGMTGHQVWTTLHANNAIASIQRLMDMGVDAYLVTDPALTTGVINQSLLPVLCPHCKVPADGAELSAPLRTRLENMQLMEPAYCKGAGCKACGGMGVIGRTVAAEVLLPTHAFMQTFLEKGPAAARRLWINELDGITKTAHAITKIKAGIVDPRHAESVIGPLDFDRQITEVRHDR